MCDGSIFRSVVKKLGKNNFLNVKIFFKFQILMMYIAILLSIIQSHNQIADVLYKQIPSNPQFNNGDNHVIPSEICKHISVVNYRKTVNAGSYILPYLQQFNFAHECSNKYNKATAIVSFL